MTGCAQSVDCGGIWNVRNRSKQTSEMRVERSERGSYLVHVPGVSGKIKTVVLEPQLASLLVHQRLCLILLRAATANFDGMLYICERLVTPSQFEARLTALSVQLRQSMYVRSIFDGKYKATVERKELRSKQHLRILIFCGLQSRDK